MFYIFCVWTKLPEVNVMMMMMIYRKQQQMQYNVSKQTNRDDCTLKSMRILLLIMCVQFITPVGRITNKQTEKQKKLKDKMPNAN